MEVFQDLKLKPKNPESIDLLISRIREKANNSDWTVKNDFVENYRKNLGENEKKVICLMSPKIKISDKEIQAYVWLGQWKSTLDVFNIVPIKTGSLSFSEYNYILQQFYKLFIEQEIEKLEFEIVYTESEKSIEKLAGEEVARALKKFSLAANKSTGHSRQMDSEKWKEFICLAHKLKSELGVEELVRWLKDDEGWSDDKAWDLGLDYEYSMDLLNYYDSNFSIND
ncbi:hypothetical protein [Microbacter margulisiae]|uniref:Uncharacterized protein n=1 Tax=Microbacter margulisiae TaxID=1350067 RepID=A0A7W5DP14_9PORP|nr:hypothetical protein [Microbacter margulisiae]MBB3186098.1 hypothetical protein [Microbacter margulisiae]